MGKRRQDVPANQELGNKRSSLKIKESLNVREARGRLAPLARHLRLLADFRFLQLFGLRNRVNLDYSLDKKQVRQQSGALAKPSGTRAPSE